MGVTLRFLESVFRNRRCTFVARKLHGTVNECNGGMESNSTKSFLGCEEHGRYFIWNDCEPILHIHNLQMNMNVANEPAFEKLEVTYLEQLLHCLLQRMCSCVIV